MTTIFETCRPRADVLAGSIAEADFAADLAQVLTGKGSADYVDPVRFFANTFPTQGLRNVLVNVCRRLTGAGGEAAAVFRLDTSYGGGKTHGLIALAHAAGGMAGVSNVEEFIDPSLAPKGNVRIAAFDGENADPANGRKMSDDVKAYTPWGEIAWALGGNQGYERVRESDEKRIAPGAETLRELFGGEPTLILLDELSVYLRKTSKLAEGEQLTAFLTGLIKAVESAPGAALVYTLAIGKDGVATDAYSAENQIIADRMEQAKSVSARKATLLNPTEDDEMVQVLRRRLFESIGDSGSVVGTYRSLWAANREALPDSASLPETADTFGKSYPFHPEVLKTLTDKTATLGSFQRVRGMLRLLARTIAHLWEERPADATAIHLHHIDPGHEPIRQEVVTRLEQGAYTPAIGSDIAGSGEKKALAEEIDAEHHGGLPPYTVYAARTVFMHTLAFNERLIGLSPDQLRYSMLGPATDVSFIEEARKKFLAESAYLDDRPGVPMRFLAEANLRQIVRREEEHVDAGDARAELNDRIREIFKGPTFETVAFPGGPFDVPDEVGDGRPNLVVLSYDGVTIGGSVESVPDLVQRIHSRKGSEGSALRALRNNLVFSVADEARKDDMRRKTRHRLALRELKKPERLADLAEYQQAQVREMEARSEHELAIAIQQCYRHLFYPSRAGKGDLEHSAIDMHSASDQPGAGQRQVVRALRDLGKLRLSEDEPDSPAYVRDRTPLRKGEMTALALRAEFRRDPALPVLIGDDIFVRGVRRGVEQGDYVYRRGDLVYGPGDPSASIVIDEQSVIFTMAHAREARIWPRQEASGPIGDSPPTPPEPSAGSGKDSGGDSSAAHSFAAEGLLREALLKLWEQARAAKVEAVGSVSIRMFEAGDAFPLLPAVRTVAGAEKKVTLKGGYETRDGGSFELEFQGSVEDAQPVREFLEPQLRDASSGNLEAGFELAFGDGLSMQGDAADKFTERLSRFASGAAYVSATAEASK